MELVLRYVHAVTGGLPAEQRGDIEKELRGLIEDMLEERTGRDSSSADVAEIEAVLLELGPPAELAAKYRGRSRYLIGPELFDSYVRVLKVVGVAIVIAMSVVLILERSLNGDSGTETFGSLITEWMGSIVEAGFQGFVWVTVIFGLLEYKGIKEAGLASSKKKSWKPSDLAPIPESQLQIKKSEPVFSIIFTVLFATVLIHSPEWLGVYLSRFNDSVHITFLNAETLQAYAPLIWGSAALVILRESLKLAAGKWSKQLFVSHLAIDVILFIAAMVLFADASVWNDQFAVQLHQLALQWADGKDFDTVLSIWDNVTNNFIFLIVAIFIAEVVLLLVKASKLRKYL